MTIYEEIQKAIKGLETLILNLSKITLLVDSSYIVASSDMKPCSPVGDYRRFGGICRLNLTAAAT
jgi:hypothetical protein